MAFLASKYQGGINVNDIDRIAPLFSGGESLEYKITDAPTLQGLTRQSTEVNQALAVLNTELDVLTAKLNGGDQSVLQDIVETKAQIGTLMGHKTLLENNIENYNETKNNPYKDNTQYNGVIPNTYVSALAFITGQADENTATSETWNRFNDIYANGMPLYDDNRNVNQYNPPAILTETKSYLEAIKEEINSIDAKHGVKIGGDNLKEAGQELIRTTTDVYTSNAQALFKAVDESIRNIFTNKAYNSQVASLVVDKLRSTYNPDTKKFEFNTSYVVNTSGIPALSGATYIELVDGKGNKYANAYVEGTPTPYLYKINANGTFDRVYGEQPNDLVLSREKLLSDEEHDFMNIYIGFNTDNNNSDTNIAKLYNAVKAIDKTYKEEYVGEEDDEDKDKFVEFVTNLTAKAVALGDGIVNKLVVDHIELKLQHEVFKHLDIFVSDENYGKDNSPKSAGDKGEGLDLGVILDNNVSNQIVMNGKNKNGIGINFNSTRYQTSVPGELIKRFFGEDLYKKLTPNNSNETGNQDLYASVGGNMFLVNKSGLGVIDQFASNQVLVEMQIGFEGVSYYVPLDGIDRRAYITQADNQLSIMTSAAGGYYNLGDNYKIGDVATTNNSLYANVHGVIPLKEYVNIPFYMSTDEFFKGDFAKEINVDGKYLSGMHVKNLLGNRTDIGKYGAFGASQERTSASKITLQELCVLSNKDAVISKIEALGGVDAILRYGMSYKGYMDGKENEEFKTEINKGLYLYTLEDSYAPSREFQSTVSLDLVPYVIEYFGGLENIAKLDAKGLKEYIDNKGDIVEFIADKISSRAKAATDKYYKDNYKVSKHTDSEGNSKEFVEVSLQKLYPNYKSWKIVEKIYNFDNPSNNKIGVFHYMVHTDKNGKVTRSIKNDKKKDINENSWIAFKGGVKQDLGRFLVTGTDKEKKQINEFRKKLESGEFNNTGSVNIVR